MTNTKKIASDAQIKQCTIKEKDQDLKLDDLSFGSEQIEKIIVFIEAKEVLSITIAAKDKKLKIPPIETQAVITSCSIKPAAQDIKFGGLKIKNLDTLKLFITEQVPLEFVIERIQETLPGMK